MKSIIVLAGLILFSCAGDSEDFKPKKVPTGASLRFDIHLNPRIYRLSNFGEPPQMALWLESIDGNEIRTVWVTQRLAKGIWIGKVICPTALPYWISRREIEKRNGIPSFLRPLPDGITGATPRENLTIYVSIEPGSIWRYFLELNVSGDYNKTFPPTMSNGAPDPDGNGQPSLIYSGVAKADTGWSDFPKLVGRTEQLVASSQINPDLKGITTAQQVLQQLEVSYLPPVLESRRYNR